MSALIFSWRSTSRRPVGYTIHVTRDNLKAMGNPQFNISTRGIIPQKQQSFRVSLPCTGQLTAVVGMRMLLNTTGGARTSIAVKRAKTCHEDKLITPRPQNVGPRTGWASASLGTLYVAIGTACTFTVLLITVAALTYLKLKRNRMRMLCSPHCCSTSYGTVPVMPTLHNESYATIASFKKVPYTQVETKQSSPLHYASSMVSQTHSVPQSQLHSMPRSEGFPFAHLQTFSLPYSPAQSRHSQLSWTAPSHNTSVHSQPDPRTAPEERVSQWASKMAVPNSRVSLLSLLQEGTFARVFSAFYRLPQGPKVNVMVKTISDDASQSQADLLVRECLITADIQHENVWSVIALCIEDPKRPLALYPHLEAANLKQWLQVHGPLCTREVADLAVQICLGLTHLHSRDILHADVAARNCVLDNQMQLRITDTALARDLFPIDYHCLGDNENRPVRWLSIEALTHRHFSQQADSWSTGVLLWELVTGAQTPYEEVDPFEMASYLRDGYRLAQPTNCPDQLFAIMARCWTPQPSDRPNLPSLLSSITLFRDQLASYI